MKTKPILVILAAVVMLLAGSAFLIRSKFYGEDEKQQQLLRFLNGFDQQVKEGNADSLLTYFAAGKDRKNIERLAGLLAGISGLNGENAPLFGVCFVTDKCAVRTTGKTAEIVIPVIFKRDSLAGGQSSLSLRLQQDRGGKYLVIQADVRKFLSDYERYEMQVKRQAGDEDIYHLVSRMAYKNSEKLKTRYDTVMWFDHVNYQTYYYVIKGKVIPDFYYPEMHGAFIHVLKREKPDYKIGVVGPDLKEIIPAQYDLVHNIGGTVDGLIEVEKGRKRGLYNLNGKLVAPVIYDQIYPLNDDQNLALLKENNNYFFLKNDTTVSDKISGFKIADMLPKFRAFGKSLTIPQATPKNFMECNEQELQEDVVIPPSCLTDLHLLPKVMPQDIPAFRSKVVVSWPKQMELKYNGTQKQKNDGNWLTGIYYSVFNHFIDGRSTFYMTDETRSVVLVDEKQNKIFGFDTARFIGDDRESKNLTCNENSFKAINDTLFEFRTTGNPYARLNNPNDYVVQAPVYYYLHVSGDKLVALPGSRAFACTQYVKMDDSYLNGCYTFYRSSKYAQSDHLTPDVLEYMKNEIYASYGYKFTDQYWNNVFRFSFGRVKINLVNSVDDQLTETDKYNLKWLDSKLQAAKKDALASR